MKKRISAFILVAALISAIFPYAVSAQMEQNPDVLGLLNSLEIVSENEITEENIDESISRINFAVFAARALGIDEMGISDVNYYHDVPEDHWGKFCINSLAELGILTTYGNTFRPDDAITKAEAARIAVGAIGLGSEAEKRGGYPSGYLSVASEEGIFEHAGAGEVITYKSAAAILYNMLESEIVQMNFTTGEASYSKRGETMLSMYHDVTEAKGYVNAVYGVSVDQNVAKDGEIIIGGSRYITDAWYYEYLGMNVEFFIRDTGDDMELVYIRQNADKKNKIIHLTSDRYRGYADGAITYDMGDGTTRRLKKADIYSGAVVIRNGENVSTNMTVGLAGFYGTMRIIDTGRFNGADIIIIEDYINVAVSNINESDFIISDKYNPALSFELENDDNRLIKFFDKDGAEKSFEDISKNDVISIAQGVQKRFAIVRLNDGEISGKIDAKETDGINAYITIDGVEYDAEPGFYTSFETVLTLGVSGTFKTDILGKIAYHSLESGDGYKYAFIIDARIGSELDGADLGEERVIMKMFTEDGERLRVACAEKVNIDSEIYKKPRAILGVFEKDGSVKPQLIRFKYDLNEHIKTIDTATYKTGEGQYSLRLQNELDKNLYGSWFGMVGQNAYLKPETKVMVVPPEGQEKTANPVFYMMKNAAYLKLSTTIRVDLFQLDPKTFNTDFVVFYQRPATTVATDSYAELRVVEDKFMTLNADDEPTMCLTLDSSGTNANFLISQSYTTTGGNVDPNALNVGDIVRVSANNQREITAMHRVLDYERAVADGNSDFFDNALKNEYKAANGTPYGNFFTGFKFSYGYVALVEGNVLQWGYDKPGDRNEIYDVTASSSKAKILVFDDEKLDDKLRSGTISDIVGFYQSAGGFSKIVSISRAGIIEQLIVYK